MRPARASMSLVVIAPMMVVLAGCPSLDGFAGDGGGIDATPEADVDAGGPSGGFLSLEDAVRFCSKALTCPTLSMSTQISLDIPIDSKNFSGCVSWLSSTLPSDRAGVTQAQKALECATQSTSCSNAAGCMWFEYVSGTDPRCVGFTGGQFGACSPNLTATYQCNYGFIAHCDNSFNYTGSSCLQGNKGYYFCAVSSGLCASDGGTPSSCSGSFYEYCNEGFLVGYDCNVQGMTCGKDPTTQQFACLSNGKNKPCTQPGTVTCAGTTVDVCDGLLSSEFNCGTLGGTCDGSGAMPRCALPTDSCSPYDGSVNACDGDNVSLCVGGQPLSFDCTTVGMHCAPASGKISAHCE